MSSATPSAPSSDFTNDEIALVCAEIFIDVAGLRKAGAATSPVEVLSAPFESFGIDSLTTMEFVMAVEERFGVELDEKALIDRGKTVADLAALVAEARRA
jgi:acyl carrier protein